MLDMLMFSVIFATVQVLMGLLVTYLLMKLFTSPKFVKAYTKWFIKTMQEVTEELEDVDL